MLLEVKLSNRADSPRIQDKRDVKITRKNHSDLKKLSQRVAKSRRRLKPAETKDSFGVTFEALKRARGKVLKTLKS